MSLIRSAMYVHIIINNLGENKVVHADITNIIKYRIG